MASVFSDEIQSFNSNTPKLTALNVSKTDKHVIFQPKGASQSKQGKKAEQKQSQAARKALLKRLLLILSTFLAQSQRRISYRTLLTCLENRKFCAYRKLGRLFRTPLMNSWITWTSRGQRSVAGNSLMSCIAQTSNCSKILLRSVQKTSGLFDTVQAGNETVAGKASTPMYLGKMDLGEGQFPMTAGQCPMTTGEADLGGLFDLAMEGMMDGEFLDSFTDLSNFFMMESDAASAVVSLEDSNGKLDFSGIASQLNNRSPAVAASALEEIPRPSATPAPKKRKCVPYSETAVSKENLIDIESCLQPETSVADHDYVTRKKQRLATPVVVGTSAAVDVISTTDVTASDTDSDVFIEKLGRKKDKYRQRRDKNNEASRRSRQIRKRKFVEMDKEADELEVKNEALRKKIVELEALAKTMKAHLIQKMTSK